MALTLVVLPIGNGLDITRRGADFLALHHSFLAEDTRSFANLLRFLTIDPQKKKIESFHGHSTDKISKIVKRLKRGEELALVSKAGSPILSDPAYPLVKETLESGIPLKVIPGVNAPTLALEYSGLPPIPYSFHGFLPRKEGEIRSFFQGSAPGTHIFFESPYRIASTLKILGQELPMAQVCLARELSKKFEEAIRFKAEEYQQIVEKLSLKGEFVLLYHIGKTRTTLQKKDKKISDLAKKVLEKNSNKSLSQLLGEILGQNAKEIYKKLNS